MKDFTHGSSLRWHRSGRDEYRLTLVNSAGSNHGAAESDARQGGAEPALGYMFQKRWVQPYESMVGIPADELVVSVRA